MRASKEGAPQESGVSVEMRILSRSSTLSFWSEGAGAGAGAGGHPTCPAAPFTLTLGVPSSAENEYAKKWIALFDPEWGKSRSERSSTALRTELSELILLSDAERPPASIVESALLILRDHLLSKFCPWSSENYGYGVEFVFNEDDSAFIKAITSQMNGVVVCYSLNHPAFRKDALLKIGVAPDGEIEKAEAADWLPG